jgi:hypothetical protein
VAAKGDVDIAGNVTTGMGADVTAWTPEIERVSRSCRVTADVGMMVTGGERSPCPAGRSPTGRHPEPGTWRLTACT